MDFFFHNQLRNIYTTEAQRTQRGRAATKDIHHRGHRDHRENAKITKPEKCRKAATKCLPKFQDFEGK
jgi:hypothetical protein